MMKINQMTSSVDKNLFSMSLIFNKIQYVQRKSGRVDRASATETFDMGSIPGRVEPTTRRIVIHIFPVKVIV